MLVDDILRGVGRKVARLGAATVNMRPQPTLQLHIFVVLGGHVSLRRPPSDGLQVIELAACRSLAYGHGALIELVLFRRAARLLLGGRLLLHHDAHRLGLRTAVLGTNHRHALVKGHDDRITLGHRRVFAARRRHGRPEAHRNAHVKRRLRELLLRTPLLVNLGGALHHSLLVQLPQIALRPELDEVGTPTIRRRADAS